MTNEDIIKMARKSGLIGVADTAKSLPPERIEVIKCFAGLVASVEREECANVCESMSREWRTRETNQQHYSSAAMGAGACIIAIRTRGNA